MTIILNNINVFRKSTFNIFVILISLLSLVSCSKVTDDNEFINPDSKILQLRVVGIDAPMELMANKAIHNEQLGNSDLQTIKNSDIYYTTSFHSTSTAHNSLKENFKTQLNRKEKFTNTTSLSLEINYRFILFLKKGNNYEYVGHKDKISTSSYEPANLEVLVGETYKWVAYSYNENTPITDSISADNLSITTAIDKDLLYACNEITIPKSEENLSIDIRFKHRLARLAITLKSDEYPAVMPDYLTKQSNTKLSIKLANASVNYFKKGDFNILDNKIYNVSEVSYTDDLPIGALINPSGDAIRVAYLYTADLVNKLSDLELTVKNLELVSNDINTFRDLDFPIISNQNFVIKALSNVVPTSGFSYSPTINFKSIGEGLVKNGCVLWANGNLNFTPNDASGETGVYSINYSINPSVASSVNDYWMFNSLTPWDKEIAKEPETPENHPHEAGNKWIVDPCKELEKGLSENDSKYSWRMPTYKEVLALEQYATDSTRKVTSNWDNDFKITFARTKDIINIPLNSYISYKLDGGRWITFYKTGAVNVQGYDNRNNLNEWSLNTDDSFFIPVFNAIGNVNSYRVLHMDGEKDLFKDDTKDKKIKTPIRCVKTYNVPECASYAANPDYSRP